MSKYVTIDTDGRATAFYDEAVHGPYYTQIPDPPWTAPQVPDPEWSPPMILDPDWRPPQIPDPDWTPGEGESEADRPFIDDPAAEQSSIPDLTATAPLVDDPEASAPLVATTDYNVGATQIPQGALAIDEATWQAWIADTAGQRWTGAALEPFTDPLRYAAETLKQAVKDEAERRLEDGVDVPGLGRFKTDDRSLTRLQGILRSAEMMAAAGQPVVLTFMTEAGAEASIASVQDVLDIFMPAWSHVGAVLATSAALQASIETMTEAERQAFDPAAQPDWPLAAPSLP